MHNLPLREYQKTAITFAEGKGACVLNLDTGMGKTRTAIEIAIQNDLYTGVISPAYLKLHWEKQIHLWSREKKRDFGLFDMFSYAYFQKKKIKFGKKELLILDESHYLKNPASTRSMIILQKILPHIPKIVFLTATPYVTNAADLWTMYNTCEPGRWGTYDEFCQKYCEAVPDSWSKNRVKYKHIKKEMAAELREGGKRFMLTMRKKDHQKELPEKTITHVELDIHNKRFIVQDREKAESGVEEETVSLASERRDLGASKISDICDFLISCNDSAVCFTYHKDVAHSIRIALLDQGESCEVITGDTYMHERQKIIERFQAGKFKILIGTTGALSVGVDLTRASIGVFGEIPWNYTELYQCMGRLHREGQKNPVNFYIFIAQGTLDEIAIKVLRRKEEGAMLLEA